MCRNPACHCLCNDATTGLQLGAAVQRRSSAGGDGADNLLSPGSTASYASSTRWRSQPGGGSGQQLTQATGAQAHMQEAACRGQASHAAEEHAADPAELAAYEAEGVDAMPAPAAAMRASQFGLQGPIDISSLWVRGTPSASSIGSAAPSMPQSERSGEWWPQQQEQSGAHTPAASGRGSSSPWMDEQQLGGAAGEVGCGHHAHTAAQGAFQLQLC